MEAGGSVNPLRQQMINMMYLVLMALLALNVSADILKAFAIVNKGLDKTNVNYEEKNAIAMAEFRDLMKVDKGAAQKYYDNALNAQKASDDMYNYIESVKERIASLSGGWKAGTDHATVVDEDNLETSTRYFIEEGHGKKMRDSLVAYMTTMKGLLDKPDAIPVKLDVNDPAPTQDGTHKNWASFYWEGVPSVAAITELTKFQNDVRNAEAEVTNYNMGRVGQAKYSFDILSPVISSETPVLSMGQDYQAKVFLGAVSSTTIPKITVNGVPQKVVNGMADFREIASSGGTKTLNVGITVPNPKKPGTDTTYSTKTEYTVFAGASTISAEKMNMLYIGLDNPIAISAAGFRPEQTFVVFSGKGDLKQVSPGHFTFNPKAQKEVTATCYVRTDDGTTRQMGSPVTYRVRNVPKPEILLGTNNTGRISIGEVKTASRINAGLGELFPYSGLNYKVNSYKIGVNHGGKMNMLSTPVESSSITQPVRDLLNTIHSGDMIVIAEVNCTAPDGRTISMPGTNWTVR